MRRGLLLLAVAALLVALLPSEGWAWSPGTHIFLGQSVLANLPLLPGAVADLLRAFPIDFLYGSIAADTSFAKKYAPVGRHSHAWHVGQEIAELAGSESLRAFGLGYRGVCLLGTDCPAVDAAAVTEVFAALDAHDAALGPAHDGGYWTLGLARELPVFEGMAWSTETVADETRARLRVCGARWAELAEARDLDTVDDLAFWSARGWTP